jgi:hypothetical protein
MAQRPKGCQSKVMTADGLVDADPKNVYALVISCEGATEGDKIALRDGSATADVKLICVVPTDNDSVSINLGRYGIEFTNGIYYTEQANAAGKIRTTVVYG